MVTDNNAPFADYVIFASGYGQPAKFSENKLGTINLNIIGLQRAFKCLKLGGKLLYVSSSEVYSGAPSPHKETDIGTTTPQHPRACYIEGKRCGEAICMAYKEQGYDVKIARLALAYGPGTKKGDTRVLNQFIEQAITTKNITVKSTGEELRTYIYVDDAVNLLLKILFEGKQTVYNVGGESHVSIKELAMKIFDLECEISGVSNVGFVGIVGGHMNGSPENVYLDMSNTLREFPTEFIPLDEGLKRTIEYQKELYAR